MILVTAARASSGAIVRLLSQQGVAARAILRNPQKAANLPAITWATCDLAKPETVRVAFDRADTLFLVSSIDEDAVAPQRNAITATSRHGLAQIVKLSAFDASGHSKSTDLPLA